MSKATVLTDRFDRALLYATHVHGGQVRKETSTPYVAHLLAVAATVLEYGGDEDPAIAALLHTIALKIRAARRGWMTSQPVRRGRGADRGSLLR
jgi:(p)ppGpp synthase/HD superfamily hydrolase